MSGRNLYRELTALLKKEGWFLARKSGHEIWKKNGQKTILVVPRNLQKKHTANGILKDAGREKKF